MDAGASAFPKVSWIPAESGDPKTKTASRFDRGKSSIARQTTVKPPAIAISRSPMTTSQMIESAITTAMADPKTFARRVMKSVYYTGGVAALEV